MTIEYFFTFENKCRVCKSEIVDYCTSCGAGVCSNHIASCYQGCATCTDCATSSVGALCIDAGNYVLAKVRWLTAEEGGRKTPIKNGYTGQIYFANETSDWSARHQYDQEIILPGTILKVKLGFLFPEKIKNIKVGDGFWMREGSKVCGTGCVVALLQLKE